MKREEIFTEENEEKDCQSYVSPTERYVLQISSYSTRPGSWNCSRGRIYAGDAPPGSTNPQLIADVQRNYQSFPFLWIENHVDGHDYLICGSHYMGQTFVQLDTGKVFEHEPKGEDLCWRSYRLLTPTLLLVQGCYWGAPDEYRLFDVSKPENGWPEIEVGHYLDAIEKADEFDYGYTEVEVDEGGRVVWKKYEWVERATGMTAAAHDSERMKLAERRYTLLNTIGNVAEVEELEKQISAYYDRDTPYDAPDAWKSQILMLITLDPETKTTKIWKSPHLVEREAASAVHREKRLQQQQRWLEMPIIEHLRAQHGKLDIGYSGRALVDAGLPNQTSVLISIAKAKDGKRSASISIGVDEGDLQLQTWEYGVGTKNQPFQRTPEGADQAWAEGLRFTGEEP